MPHEVALMFPLHVRLASTMMTSAEARVKESLNEFHECFPSTKSDKDVRSLLVEPCTGRLID